MLRPWRRLRGDASPRGLRWEEDGWAAFLANGSLVAFPALEDLGFLTPRGCAAVRDACGESYGSIDLLADCWARGRLWLPTMVLGIPPSAVTDRIHGGLREKLQTMAGLAGLEPPDPPQRTIERKIHHP
jgi:hypothetical protein